MAITELGIESHNVLVVTGIGCGSKINHYVKAYGFEGLHGRVLPVATGAKLANHKLIVIGICGDGDAYGIGGNHFIHTWRRNLDITYITQDNSLYALTKGQTSPTSSKGFKSSSTPFGVIEEPINPLTTAITCGATYVGRGYAFEIDHLKELIKNGIKHKGFSLVNVLQPCPSFNKINTVGWYKERVYKIDYDTSNKENSLKLARELGDKIPIGLFYRENKSTYHEEEPQLDEKVLVDKDVENIDINKSLDRFK